MATENRQIEIIDALLVRANMAQQIITGALTDAVNLIETLRQQNEILQEKNELLKMQVDRLKDDNQLLTAELEECE